MSANIAGIRIIAKYMQTETTKTKNILNFQSIASFIEMNATKTWNLKDREQFLSQLWN